MHIYIYIYMAASWLLCYPSSASTQKILWGTKNQFWCPIFFCVPKINFGVPNLIFVYPKIKFGNPKLFFGSQESNLGTQKLTLGSPTLFQTCFKIVANKYPPVFLWSWPFTYGGGPSVYDVENIEKVLLSSYQADSWEINVYIYRVYTGYI